MATFLTCGLPPFYRDEESVHPQCRTNQVQAFGPALEETKACPCRLDPNFTILQSIRAKQQLATVASLPPGFIKRAAVAITNSASLVRGTHSRSDDLRGCAYEALAEELEAMARND